MPFKVFCTQLLTINKTTVPILLFLSPGTEEVHREEGVMVSCLPLLVVLVPTPWPVGLNVCFAQGFDKRSTSGPAFFFSETADWSTEEQ